MRYVYLALAILAEVAATLTLKQSGGFTRLGPSLLIALGYGSAFYFLSLALREMPTGIAYAIWSGAGITLIAAAAYLLRGEQLTTTALIGLALIVAGIAVLCFAEQTRVSR